MFCSSIIDFRIDSVSYLNGYCSLMFLCMFLMFFYKSEKTRVFMFFICDVMFLTSVLRSMHDPSGTS